MIECVPIPIYHHWTDSIHLFNNYGVIILTSIFRNHNFDYFTSEYYEGFYYWIILRNPPYFDGRNFKFRLTFLENFADRKMFNTVFGTFQRNF